ncbi:Uncharacterised protein [Lysinibacillus sphaericus]|uniref:Uncharacterized protein n=1 Tax=Lysinibacillus sphaericus TaxID=1421 RepID=A0AAJ5A8J5_LYSSH|nr:Uncharacterised protein [Lysinibacillus sphaericus]
MDRELTKVFDFTKGIVGNTTVYAKWEVISSGDGGSSSIRQRRNLLQSDSYRRCKSTC